MKNGNSCHHGSHEWASVCSNTDKVGTGSSADYQKDISLYSSCLSMFIANFYHAMENQEIRPLQIKLRMDFIWSKRRGFSKKGGVNTHQKYNLRMFWSLQSGLCAAKTHTRNNKYRINYLYSNECKLHTHNNNKKNEFYPLHYIALCFVSKHNTLKIHG